MPATLQDHLQDGPFLRLSRQTAQQTDWLLQHLQWGGRLGKATYELGEFSFECDELGDQQGSYASPSPDTEDDSDGQQVSHYECSCSSVTAHSHDLRSLRQ